MKAKRKRGNQKTASTKAKKSKKGLKPATVFLIAFGAIAAGGGAYLVYDRFRRRKALALDPATESKDTIIINNNIPATSSSSIPQKTSATGTSQFPLKRGSRGTLVTMLQQALANIIGESAMKANGGIDGQFGPGTANALKMAGYPETVDQATFNKITGRSQSSIQTLFDAKDVANKLYRAAQSKNLDAVIQSLQEIKSVTDYSAVNEHYKGIPIIISRTIVTDLLDYAFKTDEAGKLRIRQELLRIGLKVDGSGRWSLQGIGLYRDLVTIRDSVVTDSRGNKIPVKRNTIVGDEIQVANGMTWFRSVDNGILQIPTQDVKYTTTN